MTTEMGGQRPGSRQRPLRWQSGHPLTNADLRRREEALREAGLWDDPEELRLTVSFDAEQNGQAAGSWQCMDGDAWLKLDGGWLALGGRQWALVVDALEAYAAGSPPNGDADRRQAAALAARLRLASHEVGTPADPRHPDWVPRP